MSTDNFCDVGDYFTYAREKRIPASVTIELCTVCNLKCKHCYITEHNNFGLPLDILQNLFLQLREMGTFELVFTGGEILLRPDFFEILEMARKLGFDVILFSNATLVTSEIAKKLGKLYINMFSTSVYSLKDKVHDQITCVPGSLKKTLKGIELLKENGVNVEVKSMICKDNYQEIDNMADFCKKNGYAFVPSPFLFPKNDGDNSPVMMRLSEKELIEVMPKINEYISFEKKDKNLDDFMCESVQNSFGIEVSGVVNPCNTMSFPIGNILETKVNEIWKSRKMVEIQNMRFSDLQECRHCPSSSSCIRCAGIALKETGDFKKKYDFACLVSRCR